ncbi:MAG: hypothetical protein FJ109_12020 [Deltaproteobacteria bacterium]|nr:hypothetical protein [Deltaproteobacteria bacterium]
MPPGRPTAVRSPGLLVALVPAGAAVLLCLSAPSELRAEESDPVSVARETVEEGDRFFAQGFVVAACTQYGMAAATAPEWWYPAYKKALCDLARGQVRNAYYLLRRAELSGKEVFFVHLALARWYTAQSRLEEASAQYEAALAANKGSVEALLEQADLMLRLDRPGDALLQLKRAERYAPQNLAVQHRIARTAEQLRYLRVAERAYRYLARTGVNPRRDLAELARFYLRHQDPERAAKVLLMLSSKPQTSRELPPEKDLFEDEAPDRE